MAKKTSKRNGYQTYNPAEWVILQFGGIRATARAVGRSACAVWTWQAPAKKGGRAGDIPGRAFREILHAAVRHGVDVTVDDLMQGRRVRRASV